MKQPDYLIAPAGVTISQIGNDLLLWSSVVLVILRIGLAVKEYFKK